MEPLYQYAWLIPVLPLLGALIVGFGLIAFSENHLETAATQCHFHHGIDGDRHGAFSEPLLEPSPRPRPLYAND